MIIGEKKVSIFFGKVQQYPFPVRSNSFYFDKVQ